MAMTDLPVEFVKDTAAACVAELVAGAAATSAASCMCSSTPSSAAGWCSTATCAAGARQCRRGGVDAARSGRRGHAPPPAQLLSVASLYRPRGALPGAGPGAARGKRRPRAGDALARHHRGLAGEAAPAIALAINSAACLLDLEGVIIDGSFDRCPAGAAAGRCRACAGLLQLGRRGARRRCWPAPSAPTHARSAARCCRCMPTSRPIAICS